MEPGAAPPRLRGRGSPVPGPARLALAVLLAVVAAFFVSTLPRVRAAAGFRPAGFDPWLDGWLQGGGYVTAAVLALLRPLSSPVDRAIWAWLAAAVAARALGFLLFLAYVRRQDPLPYPSVADAAWLAMYVFLLVGLVQLARRRTRRLSALLLLDAAVGVLAAAALAVSLLYRTVLSLAAPGTPDAAVVVNLAYPVLDLMLLVAFVGVLLAYEWRPPPAAWALAIGVVGFAVVDGVFVYQSAAGTFRPGTMLSSGSMAVTALVAVAGWLPDGSRAGRREPMPNVVLPGIFALVCLAVLVFATQRDVPALGVVLAGAGVVVAIARTGLSFRALRSLAEHRREARADDLTGLANRRAFNEVLERSLARRPDDRHLALLIVDLDDFKAVNDSLGHHYGDELLRLAAPRIQQAVRSGDVVARVGGDEFAVLLADADGPLAVRIAERLRAGFRRPFQLGSRSLVIAPSVGIALVPDDGREPVELLQHADLAMYEAKATRTGHALFRRELHPSSRMRLETTERLRRAIEDGEVVVHYQPQVSLRTGAVTGVEALARWQRPDVGLVPPSGFLQQVESGGLMPLLTGVVLAEAVRQGAAWAAAGRQLTVAVNLSVTNLLDPGFPDQVVHLLATSGLPYGALELELTEDLFMADPARARTAIAALLDAGVSLVVDDYGTGFSSLGYLRDLRDIRGLKLDRSFVTHMDADPRAAAIVESTVNLAHSLGMHVVAEGVETPAVRDRLGELRCELAQGFLFSEPRPAGDLDLDVAPGVRPGPP
ncbi:putative bifunctional diguanylate cyclase/phosphodiesterase [Blastococcus deserti]|uniref:Bifunctional diguanylate cyclase/phosphodiesterase n=1 Tax=Blastococcus deserti TaxID=2259033 RepID=A0ABW4X656_9ACTN